MFRFLQFAAAALALALLCSVPVSGTGVVAFRTAGAIVLAADAAMTSYDQRGAVMSVAATGCKLGAAGPWNYVWGGLQAAGTTTDLRSSFTRTLAPSRTLSELTTAVRRFLARDIEALDWDALGTTFEVGPIATLLSTDPKPLWLARLDGPAAHRLLSLQADATPRFIKRPLDVLELTSSGAHWVRRDPGSSCPVNPHHLGESK